MTSEEKHKNIDDLVARIKARQNAGADITTLFRAIQAGDKNALARGITLVESNRSADIATAHNLLDHCLKNARSSRRIAITGTPGVGKSTFINAFTQQLIRQGKKVAILSIDPSSSISYGSILGDKTRMEDISGRTDVFIRPTAAGDTLGGVHQKTREAILLCEAAGYDHILVETVGVGQSEHMVHKMTDMLILMLLPGGGDELQGIKKGIMEMADLVLIHKADMYAPEQVDQTVSDYQHALHFSAVGDSGWTPPVLKSSVKEEELMEGVLATADSYFYHITTNGFLVQNRQEQWKSWFEDSIGWAANEVLKEKGIHLSEEYPATDELPPAKALRMIKKALQ